MFLSDLHSRAVHLDENDELRKCREDFYLNQGQIYLDGNSLGLASLATENAVLQVLRDWKSLGIYGWTQGSPPWMSLAEKISHLLAPMVGATADEIAVGNSTTVNLHQLLCTLYHPGGRRSKILTDQLSFPSNLYAIQSQLQLRGLDPQQHLVTVPSHDGFTIAESDILDRFSDEIAVAVLPSVLFQSGQLLDIQRLTREAHKHGIIVGFDCSHSVGVVQHQLDAWDADFAYWCSYKYLNGGPGASSALYLNQRHFGRAPGLAGWFGNKRDRQFCFAPEFEPPDTAQALEISTPNVLSMAPVLGSLQQISEAGLNRIRQKSMQLTSYFIELFDRSLVDLGFKLITPRQDSCRGGHVALLHPRGDRICAALISAGVVTDFRPPATIRFTPSPLYISFLELHEAVRRLHEVMKVNRLELVGQDER